MRKNKIFSGGTEPPLPRGGGFHPPNQTLGPPLPPPLPGGLLDPPLKLLASKYFQELETLTLQILLETLLRSGSKYAIYIYNTQDPLHV